jgi:hypothetical protein
VIVEISTEQRVDKILPQDLSVNQTTDRVLSEAP